MLRPDGIGGDGARELDDCPARRRSATALIAPLSQSLQAGDQGTFERVHGFDTPPQACSQPSQVGIQSAANGRRVDDQRKDPITRVFWVKTVRKTQLYFS